MANKKYSSKLLIFLSCSLLLLSASALAQSDKTQAEQSLKEVQAKLEALTKQLNKSKSDRRTARDKLVAAEQQLSKTNKDIKSNKRRVKTLEANLQGIAQALDYQERQMRQARTALASLFLSRHKSGESDFLKMLLNQENPYAVGRLSNYHSYYRDAFMQKVQTIATEAKELQHKRDVQTQQKAELDKKRSELASLSEQQQQNRKQREKHLNQIDQEVSDKQSKLTHLIENKRRLNSLLAALREQERVLREQARKQAQQQGTQQSRPVRLPVAGGFLKQKGRLQMPIDAPIKTKYGERLEASGISAEGIYFAAKLNQSVKSIFRGRVLFADYLKGYGLLIIVDHGDEHISLYGHNDSLLKGVGDMVETNEAIATSGNSGGMRSPTLYFEIRHNTNTIDPRKWCQP